ncbi:MAG: hypothetical protein QW651_03555 [Candidatus Nezhaarchaeales archaeon]
MRKTRCIILICREGKYRVIDVAEDIDKAREIAEKNKTKTYVITIIPTIH